MRTTWDLFRELDSMRREFDRLFDESGMGRIPLPLFRSAFLPGRAARAYPLLNLNEDRDTLYVEALAPGLDPESIDLSLVRDQLTLSGEKPGTNGNVKSDAYHRNERAAGRFTRTITLPAEVDSKKTTAEYKNGILRITMPKSEAAKPKQISVGVG